MNAVRKLLTATSYVTAVVALAAIVVFIAETMGVVP
jgi:hypothetical protein